ncbi:ribosomal protein S18-alanine N-acetyltransferase [Lacimicrobium alkaliphilum]|uniref:[Ribosomal protein bS18]-alanine N-acetyltransferase n=1 Tax=Lacimicrobium alkaliphilum TaxID=1526571 RepID=A0ABQ1R640_9ALTE|nr:ribosomal protein S18-alanine N-acetyltransferase [Lacimicrobium alkaliphilum]GGD55908.1 ribosomal-protein-alanine acetyltransferase [Lacimicrobium alkaliphilum]
MAAITTAPLTFSQIHSHNYDGAFHLQCACHSYPWSRSTFASCLAPPYFAWQLTANEQLIGFYVGLQVLREATLMDIGLAPSARGQGMSYLLLKHFFSQCREKNIEEIWLEVRVSNQGAIHLYHKTGFELIERRKNYYPCAEGREDALIMKYSFAQL